MIFRLKCLTDWMSTSNRDPKDDVVAKAFLQALLEIHIYQSGQAMDELKHEGIEVLAPTGVFSSHALAFLQNHQTRFYGFPERIARDIVVLEIVTSGKRFIGFSDGHVECQVHEDRPAICARDAV